jgi:hypothetical protein
VLALLILSTVLHYTVPVSETNRCTWGVVVCDSVHCDTLQVPERMAAIEVWWAPRWGPWRKLYEKNIAGLEGAADTVGVPSDTVGGVQLIARDLAGNRSCDGNVVTVNAAAVGVEGSGPGPTSASWYDLSGRRLPPEVEQRLEAAVRLQGLRSPIRQTGLPSGVYFRREAGPRSLTIKRMVILR